MIDREVGRDRFESLKVLLQEQWIQIDDWASDTYQRVAEASAVAWRWAQKRPTALRWTIVFVSVLVSTVLGLSLRTNAPAPTQLMLFLPAVLVSALYGGLFAGTVAALVGAVATVEWKMTGTAGTLGPNITSLAMYGVACSILLGLSRAQRYQQQQIREFAETLELKVQERNADLESANREVSDLCYSISHDMQAPLRNLVTSSRILIDESGKQLDSDARRRVQGIANSAIQLAAWVDDLLGYARLGPTELKPEWINITQMVDDIFSQLKDQPWGFSTLAFQVQPNLVVTGDKLLVRAALWNILENACKYAKKDQPLVVEVSEWQTNKGTFLSIRDNGIGFEQQYVRKIFEPFQRLHRDSTIAGSGIGLANVKRIVEKHGGEISADGIPDMGATIYLRFGSGRTEARAIMSNSYE